MLRYKLPLCKDPFWKPEGKKENNPFEYVRHYLTFTLTA